MIEIPVLRSTSAALMLSILGAPAQDQPSYPQRVVSYEVHQVGKTHSDFMEALTNRPQGAQVFANQIATIYAKFAERQERMGIDFEVAIFSDLESLYET